RRVRRGPRRDRGFRGARGACAAHLRRGRASAGRILVWRFCSRLGRRATDAETTGSGGACSRSLSARGGSRRYLGGPRRGGRRRAAQERARLGPSATASGRGVSGCRSFFPRKSGDVAETRRTALPRLNRFVYICRFSK